MCTFFYCLTKRCGAGESITTKHGNVGIYIIGFGIYCFTKRCGARGESITTKHGNVGIYIIEFGAFHVFVYTS